uniref:BTB domain-containing protein n=1 Tax=Mycena chlorophos TaxID=658473 RepID=A0ABQ0L3Y5_MYCCL|nr:predicted protein [Mycena chlorophos]
MASENNLERAEGLYFQDGSLIIQAENTLFRVYGQHLASHSTFFRDMLAIPTADAAESMDGCPFVRAHDSASDMNTFLKAMMYPSFFEPPPATTDFTTVAALLRLSHKYDVEWLLKRALSHMNLAHPTTLDGWYKSRDQIQHISRGCSAEQCISTIVLARSLSLLWLLPMAFYRLGRTISSKPVLESTQLSPGDKQRWIDGTRELDRTYRTTVLRFLSYPVHLQGCKNRDSSICAKLRAAYAVQATNIRLAEAEMPKTMPLDIWTQTNWQTVEASGRGQICSSCIASMKQAQRLADEECWNKLPHIFGIGDWATLEAEKTRMVGV